jgi:biopolymer transport protein ExbB
MQLLSLLQAGGIMMVPILVASVVSVALILELWWLLTRSRNRFEELRDWTGPLPKGKRGDLFSTLMVWLHANPSTSGDQKQDYADLLLGAVERRISWLNTLAAIAPLLGLLGTVSGMIHNFALVASIRPTDPLNQLSKGISEALVATGAGLVVAIIAALGHHALMNSLDSFAAQVTAFLRNRAEESERGLTAAEEPSVVGA